MKIIHLSDTHLGFRQLHRVNDAGRNEREQDVYDAWAAAIEKAVELRPAAVVHSGDLFDSYYPAAAALNCALDGLAALRDAGIPFVAVAGNHSTPRLRAADHVFAVLERFDHSGLIHAVFGTPRVVRLDGLAVHAVPHDYEKSAVAEHLSATRPLADVEHNVLVAHVGLDGLGQVVGAEAGGITVSGQTLDGAGDFDYIALGHLHKHREARDNAAYSGSLERLSWADDARQKGILEVDLDADRSRDPDYVQLRVIPTRAHVTLQAIDAATVDDLTGAIVAAAEREDLDDAMVRLSVRNVTAADWSAVDRRTIDQAFEHCLHFECEPHIVGQAATVAAPQELRDFLVAWPGAQARGVDVDDFVARAEGFLTRADRELTG